MFIDHGVQGRPVRRVWAHPPASWGRSAELACRAIPEAPNGSSRRP